MAALGADIDDMKVSYQSISYQSLLRRKDLTHRGTCSIDCTYSEGSSGRDSMIKTAKITSRAEFTVS